MIFIAISSSAFCGHLRRPAPAVWHHTLRDRPPACSSKIFRVQFHLGRSLLTFTSAYELLSAAGSSHHTG